MSPLGENRRFEDELEEHGSLVYRNVGTSMRPLIKQGRDLMVIRRKSADRCRKYDVVLYKRGGQYVLHRIVRVLPDSYVICGDNCILRERGITDGDILGVMTALLRDGREVSMDAFAPRCYARVWCALYPLRVSIMKGKRFVGRKTRKAHGS